MGISFLSPIFHSVGVLPSYEFIVVYQTKKVSYFPSNKDRIPDNNNNHDCQWCLEETEEEWIASKHLQKFFFFLFSKICWGSVRVLLGFYRCKLLMISHSRGHLNFFRKQETTTYDSDFFNLALWQDCVQIRARKSFLSELNQMVWCKLSLLRQDLLAFPTLWTAGDVSMVPCPTLSTSGVVPGVSWRRG